MVYIDEEIVAKTGVELFKELRRVYAVAEVEDYYKNAVWKDDLMKMDLQLVYAHAREAGAPYPPPLSEVKTSDLPKTGPVGGIRPGVKLPGAPLRPAPPGAKAALPAGPQSAAAGGPAAELRLIALFVAKWKLDLTRAKLMLARLTPTRRRYVIQHFKSTTVGEEATTELEAFIDECESSGAWDAAASMTSAARASAKAAGGLPTAASAAAVATAKSAAAPKSTAPPMGIKRPLLGPGPLDGNKRPRLMTTLGAAGAGMQKAAMPKITAPGAKPGMPTRPTFGTRPGMPRPMGGRPGLLGGLMKRY